MDFYIHVDSRTRHSISLKIEGIDCPSALFPNNPTFLKTDYSDDISSVPNSICVIPALGLLLPIAFVLDACIHVDELDKTYLERVEAIRKAYEKDPGLKPLGGSVIAKQIVDNNKSLSGGGLLFSNGIDATYSLIKERKSISDLFIVHGSDIPVEDETGWERVYDGARETARAFKKKLHSITSNFRKVINEGYLTGIVGKHGFEWWHDFEHGQALLSLAACPAYALGLKYLFIAASFTAESRFPCSSNPDADEAFALGGLEVIHSGFEAARCEKVKTISDFCSENAIRLNLHVCWEDKSGENCGHCEKCCRSFLAGKANGCDTSLIGLPDIDFNTLKKSIRHALLAPDKVSIFADIKNTALRHYGTENLPKELKWFVSQNFERRAGKTLSLPYYSYTLIKQFLKRCFRKCKKMLVNALSIFAQND